MPGLFESVKNSRQNFGIDPATGVFDFEAKLPIAVIRRSNAELSAIGCKLDGVLD